MTEEGLLNMDFVAELDSMMWYSFWMIGFNFSRSGKYAFSNLVVVMAIQKPN